MATNAEDDESVGEISGGEEPEFETVDVELPRLPSEEAPQLGGGGDGEIDPLDEDSDESKPQSELDESHGDSSACDAGCWNSLIEHCYCKCERCMFKYRNSNPPNERMFKTLLRQNFQSPSSTYLVDPQQRRTHWTWRRKLDPEDQRDSTQSHITLFRARRPYDYTQESDTQPCTQMIPWDVDISAWKDPCPNAGLRKDGQYHGRILPCDEVFCAKDLENLNETYEETDEGKLPDGLWSDRIQLSPPDGPTRPYICEEHIQDTKDYFCMGEDTDNLYNAHLVRFCKVHESELREKYRERAGGKTTCTCRNVDFTRWQCRPCFQTKVEKLQRQFRRRVNARFRGKADPNITDHDFYQQDPKGVRRMLQRLHPCLRGHCGRPRLKGVYQNDVLDCRCCGGFIVQQLGPRRRSARLKERKVVRYVEEGSTRGSSAEVSNGDGERDVSPWQ